MPVNISDVTVVNNDVIPSLDVSDYKFVSLQLTGTWVGTVTFQGSNDNGTFDDIVTQDMGEVSVAYTTSTTATGMYKIPTSYKFIRVRVTSFTSGIVTGTAIAYKEDSNTGQISATGTVDISANQTVGLDAGTEYIGNVAMIADPNAPALLTDFYAAQGGAVDINSRVIRGQACILYTIVMTNYAATARHVKIYDTAVAPVAGVGTPVIVLSMPSGGTIGYPLPASGLNFANGIGMTMVQGAANNSAIGTATAPDISITSIFT